MSESEWSVLSVVLLGLSKSEWSVLSVVLLGLAVVAIGIWLLLKSASVPTRLIWIAVVVVLTTYVMLGFVVVGRLVPPSGCRSYPCDPTWDSRFKFRRVLFFGGFGLSLLLIVAAAIFRWRDDLRVRRRLRSRSG